MDLSRRDLLRLGTSSLLACGAGVPLFLARTARAVAAQPGTKAKGRILVVLQLDGGNDGLNTVVPYQDDAYRKARPRLQLTTSGLHKINDRIALHPSLGGLDKLLQKQQLAIVQSVGYPNPNRSHFESMAIWHAGRLEPSADMPGWLARSLDQPRFSTTTDAPALH